MKNLEQQISDRCIHFTGIGNKTCKIGIPYADVRVDKPYKFPCLKQGGFCGSSKFPTEEEIKKELAEIQDIGKKELMAYAKIKDHFYKTKIPYGTISCECGGELKYKVVLSNGHIRGHCSKCGISFME